MRTTPILSIPWARIPLLVSFLPASFRSSSSRGCAGPSDTTFLIPSSYSHTLTVSLTPASQPSVHFAHIYHKQRTMEIYTTSFTYPRRSRLTHSPASSLDFSSDLRPSDSYSQLHQQHVNSTLPDSQGTASPSDYEAVQKVAMMAMAIYNVQISFAPADQGRAWNFQVSGVYQQVMLARGMIMKECSIQVCNYSLIFTTWSRISYFSLTPMTCPESCCNQGRTL